MKKKVQKCMNNEWKCIKITFKVSSSKPAGTTTDILKLTDLWKVAKIKIKNWENSEKRTSVFI